MAEWMNIGELFDFEKGTLQSSKCIPGEYTFITAAEEWKTHKSYTHDCEALIFAMAASGSLGRTHYIKGKFILSDLCFILTPKKSLKLDLLFYYRVFNFLRHDIVKKTATGTSKLSINRTNFREYQLPYFDYAHQVKFRDKIESVAIINDEFSNQTNNQLLLLNNLRQQILQEAIEGKLTAKWRKQNPELISGDNNASKLLEKIKSEKERLIKEGKIKKEKPLPPIIDKEKPFELPEGWVWCKLGDIATHSLGKMLDHIKNKGSYHKYLRNLNVRWFEFDLSDLLEMRFSSDEDNKYTVKKGDLLICEGGYPGRAAIWNKDYNVYIQKAIHRVRFIIHDMNKYFLYYLYLADLNGSIQQYFTGAGIQHFTGQELHKFVFPLPPIMEQKIIVDRLDKCLSMINELEKQVLERNIFSKMLMQAVLREAFEEKEK
jgi:type I restriction enzyme, S subunit